MTGTLNDMTVEQLRDLAKRAEATLKEKEAAAKEAAMLRLGYVGVIVRNDECAAVRTSTHQFAIFGDSREVRFRIGSATEGKVIDVNAPYEFSLMRQGCFSNESRDSINTAENRAAVMQLLATTRTFNHVLK